ncbi:MAG: hypothetical protein ACRDJC_10195 [Thermomicrobiales bacterium]
MVQKKQKPLAVIETDDACQEIDQQREDAWERFWQTVDRIRARNAGKDPDDVLRDVTEAVEEVRREMYERERRAQSSGGHQPLRQWNDQSGRSA